MVWHVFVEDKAFVTAALRRGEFDVVEVIAKVAETDFFRRLLGEGVLRRLAASYPTPRQKEEVPVWLYLASELTLRLHGAAGFGAYPYILHCGGLLDALGPDRVEHKLDPETGQWRTAVRGYNGKNQYTRITPCDHDYLRKMAKDTVPARLEHWFGTAVVREYQRLGAFDPAGVFVVDGTYIFVPLGNDRYERSSVLRFGPNGHPISEQEAAKLPQRQRGRCRFRRCYRAVTLSHTTPGKDYSLRCGTTVLPGVAFYHGRSRRKREGARTSSRRDMENTPRRPPAGWSARVPPSLPPWDEGSRRHPSPTARLPPAADAAGDPRSAALACPSRERQGVATSLHRGHPQFEPTGRTAI